MQYVIRRWNCPACSRHNATEVCVDGTAKCDHCAAVTPIQPSQARGGETSAELAAFLQVDAGTRPTRDERAVPVHTDAAPAKPPVPVKAPTRKVPAPDDPSTAEIAIRRDLASFLREDR